MLPFLHTAYFPKSWCVPCIEIVVQWDTKLKLENYAATNVSAKLVYPEMLLSHPRKVRADYSHWRNYALYCDSNYVTVEGDYPHTSNYVCIFSKPLRWKRLSYWAESYVCNTHYRCSGQIRLLFSFKVGLDPNYFDRTLFKFTITILALFSV